MTIRDLIAYGANLDMEICVEARTYDEDGNRIGTYYSYADIPPTSFTIDNDLLTIIADVNDVEG